jgi:type II secretory pathway component PulJ
MMYSRSGFTLIDVVIGLLISSMLSVVLYRAFLQTMRIAHMSSGLIEDYSDVLIMSAQLERDVSSVVVLKDHEKLAKKAEEQRKTSQETAEKNSAVQLSGGEKKEEEKKEEEQLAFSGVIKDNKLSSLSFVCTNALPQVDQIGSRLVRVRYFLEPDVSDASLSRLMREERTYFPPAVTMAGQAAIKSHAYNIMARIESITMKFYGTVYTPPGAQKSNSVDTEMISLSSWGNEEQRKKLKRLVPEYVEIIGNCRSQATQEAMPFSLFIAIPAGIAAGIEGREQEKQEAEKTSKQTKGTS